MKMKAALFVLLVAVATLSPTTDGGPATCKTCYGNDFCLTVLEQFGWTKCQIVTECIDVSHNGTADYYCWDECRKSNHCLTAPPS